jgi:hypothetical protein
MRFSRSSQRVLSGFSTCTGSAPFNVELVLATGPHVYYPQRNCIPVTCNRLMIHHNRAADPHVAENVADGAARERREYRILR